MSDLAPPYLSDYRCHVCQRPMQYGEQLMTWVRCSPDDPLHVVERKLAHKKCLEAKP